MGRAVTIACAAALAVCVGYARSDSVLAYCDIALQDGSTIERVVVMSRAIALDGDVTTNGFFVVRTRPNGQQVRLPYLFSRDLEWIQPNTGQRQFVSTGEHGEIPGLYTYEAYFLRDITTSDTPPHGMTETIENVEGRQVMAREKAYRSRYEMLDYVPVYDNVYAALQGECHPSMGVTAPSPTHVPLSDIRRFTVVHAPSRERLDATADAQARWQNSVIDPLEGSWPTWFDHIVTADGRDAWQFRQWEMTP